MEEEETTKKAEKYEIAQDLSQMSIEEIDEAVEQLKGEIARLEQEKQQKSKQMTAAEALFKH